MSDKHPWEKPRHGNSVRVFEGRDFNADSYTTIYSPGTWYSKAEAEALERLAEIALKQKFVLHGQYALSFNMAVEALEAGRKGRS